MVQPSASGVLLGPSKLTSTLSQSQVLHLARHYYGLQLQSQNTIAASGHCCGSCMLSVQAGCSLLTKPSCDFSAAVSMFGNSCTCMHSLSALQCQCLAVQSMPSSSIQQYNVSCCSWRMCSCSLLHSAQHQPVLSALSMLQNRNSSH